MNDKDWMYLALDQAKKAKNVNEVPVGAVLVSKNNELLGVGYNRTMQASDPSAHAEVIAIKDACLKLKNHRIPDTTLYVTLEPCAMCAGLMVHARIHRLVYASRDMKAGAAGTVYNLLNGKCLNHKVVVDEGVMEKECSTLLTDFFKTRRLG